MEQYEILFMEKKLVGKNLFQIMKEKGYTKVSLSKESNISRPTLDRIFEGEINSITTFEKHVEKLRMVFNVEVERLSANKEYLQSYYKVAYSENRPKNYVSNETEQEMFEILDSLIDLCDFYY